MPRNGRRQSGSLSFLDHHVMIAAVFTLALFASFSLIATSDDPARSAAAVRESVSSVLLASPLAPAVTGYATTPFCAPALKILYKCGPGPQQIQNLCPPTSGSYTKKNLCKVPDVCIGPAQGTQLKFKCGCDPQLAKTAACNPNDPFSIYNACPKPAILKVCPRPPATGVPLKCNPALNPPGCDCPPAGKAPWKCVAPAAGGVSSTYVDKCNRLYDCNKEKGGIEWQCKGSPPTCFCPDAAKQNTYCGKDGAGADVILDGCGTKVKACVGNTKCQLRSAPGAKPVVSSCVCQEPDASSLWCAKAGADNTLGPNGQPLVPGTELIINACGDLKKICSDQQTCKSPCPDGSDICCWTPPPPCQPTKTCADYPGSCNGDGKQVFDDGCGNDLKCACKSPWFCCPPGKKCTVNHCVDCRDDDECTDGEQCSNGKCVPKPNVCGDGIIKATNDEGAIEECEIRMNGDPVFSPLHPFDFDCVKYTQKYNNPVFFSGKLGCKKGVGPDGKTWCVFDFTKCIRCPPGKGNNCQGQYALYCDTNLVKACDMPVSGNPGEVCGTDPANVQWKTCNSVNGGTTSGTTSTSTTGGTTGTSTTGGTTGTTTGTVCASDSDVCAGKCGSVPDPNPSCPAHDCGTTGSHCPAGNVCDKDNKCCKQETAAVTKQRLCSQRPAGTCGPTNGENNCGKPISVDCACGAGQICTSGTCCTPKSDSDTCASKPCGSTVTNNCGQSVKCMNEGTCANPSYACMSGVCKCPDQTPKGCKYDGNNKLGIKINRCGDTVGTCHTTVAPDPSSEVCTIEGTTSKCVKEFCVGLPTTNPMQPTRHGDLVPMAANANTPNQNGQTGQCVGGVVAVYCCNGIATCATTTDCRNAVTIPPRCTSTDQCTLEANSGCPGTASCKKCENLYVNGVCCPKGAATVVGGDGKACCMIDNKPCVTKNGDVATIPPPSDSVSASGYAGFGTGRLQTPDTGLSYALPSVFRWIADALFG